MQNFAPFWIFVTSRFINGFFRKNSHPLSDTKVDHNSDIQGDYWADNRIIFLEYISDNCDRRRSDLFSDKKKEMNADAPESRKLRNCRAQTIFLFVPPRWHPNLLNKAHQSMLKYCTKLVNKPDPLLNNVISPLIQDQGRKLDKMKKWSLFWMHFESFLWSLYSLNNHIINYIVVWALFSTKLSFFEPSFTKTKFRITFERWN